MRGRISDIRAIKIYDSKGNETIKVTAYGDEFTGSYIFGSQERTTNFKVYVSPDIAIERIEKVIKPALLSLNYYDQIFIDDLLISLDNTKNQSYLGANTIMATSLAISRLAANEVKFSLFKYLSSLNSIILPIPIVSVFKGQDSNIIKEFLLIPGKFDDIFTASSALKKVIDKIYEECDKRNESILLDENGNRISPFSHSKETLKLMNKAVDELGFENRFIFGVSISSKEVYDEVQSKYLIENRYFSSSELLDFYNELIELKVKYFENPFDEKKNKLYIELKDRHKNQILVCSNIENIINNKDCNSTLIKMSDYANLTEIIKKCNKMKSMNILNIASTANLETEDSYLVDLCVALNIPFIRCGFINVAEKISKINRLFDIKDLIGKDDYYFAYLDFFSFLF